MRTAPQIEADQHPGQGKESGPLARLNGRNHRRSLVIFGVIVLAHLVEHIVQAVQIWGFGIERPQARGVLGQAFPVLVSDEWLHYGYALIMIVGLVVLRHGFTGASRRWWNIALGIQIWHHFEHLLLFGQAMTGVFLFGGTKPTSVVQVLVSRVELHLFYNVAVMIPMAVALYFHLYPPKGEEEPPCGCAVDVSVRQPAG